MSALRRLALPLGIAAAVLLFLLVNPWLVIDGNVRQIVTIAFWLIFIVLLIALFEDRNEPEGDEVEVEGPRFVRFLFNNTRAGLFWLPIRLFVGFSWLEAGWHKFTDPEWTQGGAALRAYWERAASIPGAGSTADHLRVVSRLHQHPPRRRSRDVVRLGRDPRGTGHRRGPDRRRADRRRRVLRGVHEHVVPAGRFGLHEPGDVHARRGPDAGLARGGVLRPRPVPPAYARHTLATDGRYPPRWHTGGYEQQLTTRMRRVKGRVESSACTRDDPWGRGGGTGFQDLPGCP